MSASPLGARKLRKIEATIGEPVLRGWSHGGYWLGFVTPDHRHGWWNVKSHEVEWVAADAPSYTHYTSCLDTWPDQPTEETE